MMKQNAFRSFHPIVNFTYFLFVIGFSMILSHPVCLGISLACSLTYCSLLVGGKPFVKRLAYILPLLVLTALINPAFNHRGVTILTYLPSGNPLTLESILFGLGAAGMLVCVLNWFSCYNNVMTDDKFVYLFGRLLPSLSLILSMTLRFVPRFAERWHTVSQAQKCVGRGASDGNLFTRAKNSLTILSIMVTWFLENAIDTSDSMKARGYGLPGRTAFSVFTFDARDLRSLLLILFCGVYLSVGKIDNGMYFRYFPSLKTGEITIYEISLFAVYGVLCAFPIAIELWEVKKWKAIRSNM